MARSRENAYQVREALVRPAMPQNSWPTVAMMIVSFAAHELERGGDDRDRAAAAGVDVA